MRVVFMGTPDFAAASLKELIDAGFDIPAVYTQPDRPRGRGMELSFTPVKSLALENGLPVFQPESLREGDAADRLRLLKPDFIAVVAYGKILPKEILDIPKYGCINVHASLLPKYRGSAPIQWAVLNGDRETGVTTMYLAPKLDSGDIIYQDKTEIGDYETSGELFDRLMPIGARLLVKTLRDIECGTAPRTPQNDAEATLAPMLDKSLCPIDFSKSAREVIKWIYGLQPWPVATAVIGGAVCRVFEARTAPERSACPAGTVISASESGIRFVCGGGETVDITSVQAAGKRRMSAAEYLRGHPLAVNVREGRNG